MNQSLATRMTRYMPLLIISAGVIAYTNSFANPFIFDDHVVISGIAKSRGLLSLPQMSRLIVYLSLKFNYTVSGMRVADYHALNLLIHISAGLLLCGIVRRTLLLPRLAARYADAAPWIAAISAATWVAHPLQTESVTYICQRFESMAGLFFLLCLYCFVRATGSDHRRSWYNACLLACILGMGTKEIMIAAPAVVLLYDYIFLSGSLPDKWKARWRVHVALFATLGIRAVLQCFVFLANREAGIYIVSGVSSFDYLLTQSGVIIHYLRLAVFPYPLCLDYDWPLVTNLTTVLLQGTIVVGLVVGSLVALWRRATVGFLGAWFFIILAPTSSILPLDDVAVEHRMYLPLAAVIVLLVTGAYNVIEYIDRRRSRPTSTHLWRGMLLAGIVIACLVQLTILRNRDYRSELAMWSDVVDKRPDNLRARNDLAAALCENGRHGAAMEHYAYVLNHTKNMVQSTPVDQAPARAMPNNSPAYNRFRAFANMGLLAFNRGRQEDAVANYVEALRIIPGSGEALAKLRRTLIAGGTEPEHVDAEIHRLLTHHTSGP